jgi:hypothetical protein
VQGIFPTAMSETVDPDQEMERDEVWRIATGKGGF